MYEKKGNRIYFLRISIFKRQSGEKKTWKEVLDKIPQDHRMGACGTLSFSFCNLTTDAI